MTSDPVRVQESVQFGKEYTLDLNARRLHCANDVLKLERIPAEILVLLVQRRGQLVSREEIVSRIWGDGTFLDTDNSIRGAIRKIRRALKDDAEQPQFVQTVTGQGYRFIGQVVELRHEEAESVTALALDTPIHDRGVVISRFPGQRWRIEIAILLGILVIAGAWLFWNRVEAKRQSSRGRLMLAVLPFENLTGDSSQDYLSEGVTEEMIGRLGNLDAEGLGVIAKTSVMPYKNAKAPVSQVARDLGVQYVLEGSVRRDLNIVRISAQLIEVKNQTHLWVRQYDRELKNLFTVQGEIAQDVADQIEATLSERHSFARGRQHSPSPATYEAYDLYLKGRYSWNKRTPAGFRLAAEYFAQAVSIDPRFARAYAGLADSYSLMSSYHLGPVTELIPKARAAALEALQLDGELAEGHASLALISENYDWDWKTAELEFRRAIQLDPNYATAYHWYGEFLGMQGRFDEALVEIERAHQLDPLSLAIASDKGAILYFSRRYESAIEQFRAVLEVDPAFLRARLIYAAYTQSGRFAEALASIEKWRTDNDARWIWAAQAYVYGKAGRQSEARLALKKLQQESFDRCEIDVPLYVVAHLGVNEKDKVITCLQAAHVKRSDALTTLKVDPIFDPLRNDSRFQDLLRELQTAP